MILEVLTLSYFLSSDTLKVAIFPIVLPRLYIYIYIYIYQVTFSIMEQPVLSLLARSPPIVTIASGNAPHLLIMTSDNSSKPF
jgi:hypothetical protein